MSGIFNKRHILAASLAVLAAGGAHFLFAQTTPPPAAPAIAPLDDSKPIAVINGREINNAAFNNLLMQVAGMRVFQQVFDLTLVQRACADAGIPTEGTDFQARMKAEFQHTLDGLNVQGVKDEDKPKLLDEVLRRQGVTAVEFQMGLERQAGLRALAKGKIDITDKDLTDAYEAQYGERVQVRLFQVGTTEKGAALRVAIEQDKKTPEAAAAGLGLPAPASWTISKNAGQIDAIKDVAFTRKEKELSAPVQFQNTLVMVYVDQKIASTMSPTGPTSFGVVKDKVKNDVLNFKETQWMNAHLANLRANASVNINNKVLNDQFVAIKEAMDRQNAAAASQPGAAQAPATTPATSRPAPK